MTPPASGTAGRITAMPSPAVAVRATAGSAVSPLASASGSAPVRLASSKVVSGRTPAVTALLASKVATGSSGLSSTPCQSAAGTSVGSGVTPGVGAALSEGSPVAPEGVGLAGRAPVAVGFGSPEATDEAEGEAGAPPVQAASSIEAATTMTRAPPGREVEREERMGRRVVARMGPAPWSRRCRAPPVRPPL